MTARDAMERLGKWRTIFAGWQLGTRPKGDPETDAIRDHREQSLMLRVEMSALETLLIRKGLITEPEFEAALEREANQLCRVFSDRFPGVTATDQGLTIEVAKARKWMDDMNWRP